MINSNRVSQSTPSSNSKYTGKKEISRAVQLSKPFLKIHSMNEPPVSIACSPIFTYQKF